MPACLFLTWLLATRPALELEAADSNPSADLGGATNRLETLARLTLEDVLNREVTSVSKRPEKMFAAPAAVSVITGEDIRRSGARRLPEILRLAPGLTVSQADANTWAVSARGFQNVFSDKLLVMIDGRTIYTPVFSGVFWNIQDYLLEDIDHIEVVRGPGGTLWGANAVNGVINIITKDARDTQGVYTTGGGGTAERGFAGGRYGLKLGETGFLRLYGQYADRSHFPGGNDSSDMAQGGFRADWSVAEAHLTFQGDYYSENHGSRIASVNFAPPYFPFSDERFHYFGGNALFRYRREFSQESDLQFQTYYDRAARSEFGAESLQHILDAELQHRIALPLGQNVMYGFGYRYYPDHLEDNALMHFARVSRNSQLASAFIQDEITVVEDRLRLVLGSKIEHNDYTGWEVQPNARVVWQPTDRQTVWGAASRAVQIPGRIHHDLTLTAAALDPINVNGLPLFIRGIPNPNLQAQELVAYELGYRIQAAETLSFDIAGFYNNYDGLVTGAIGTPFFEPTTAPHLILPAFAVNGGEGSTRGFELTSQWRVTDEWQLSGTYSFLELEAASLFGSQLARGRDPQNQISLRSSLDLPGRWEFDVWGRFVDRLPDLSVRSYFDLDLRLAWHPVRHVELAVVAQNLISPRRIEFAEDPNIRTQVTPVPRGVYGQLTIRF